MSKKLKNIQIENFKSIKYIDLNLRNLNVLIGPNGAGKSNFIRVFNFLHQIIDKRLKIFTGESGGADSLLHFGKKFSENMIIKLTFKDPHTKIQDGYKIVLNPTTRDDFIIDEESVFYQKPDYERPYTEYVNVGTEESKLKDSSVGGISSYVTEEMKSWRIYHFNDTSKSAKIKQTVDINDNEYLRADASNLAAFLYYLEKRHPEHFRNIQDTIRLVAPFFDRFNLHPQRLNPDKILIEWMEKNSESYFNANAFSDGTLRFICLATLLQQPELPPLVIIDEPELGLHPYAISLLASMLKSASTKSQIIVSTQSVTLVNQFEPQDIVVVELDDGKTILKNLEMKDIKSWLNEFGLGDLWEKNILGGRP